MPRHPSATSQFSHPNRVLGLLSCRTPTPLLLPPLRCGAHLSGHNRVATAWRTPGTHGPPQPQGPTRVPPVPRTQPDTGRKQSPRFGTGSKLQRHQYRHECQRRGRALGPQGPSCRSCCSAPVITHPLPCPRCTRADGFHQMAQHRASQSSDSCSHTEANHHATAALAPRTPAPQPTPLPLTGKFFLPQTHTRSPAFVPLILTRAACEPSSHPSLPTPSSGSFSTFLTASQDPSGPQPPPSASPSSLSCQ